MNASRLMSAAVALTVTLGLTGCGGGGGGGILPAGASAVTPVRPVGLQDPADIPDGANAGSASCDPRASLRPAATQPRPGQMPAGSTMARILQRGRLIVGVDQNSYRFGFRDPLTGELTGFDVDVAREVARAIFGDPSKIQFRATNSASRIPSLQDGTVDIVVQTMTMNCERWQKVNFSTEYFTAGQRILVRRGSPVRSIADLGGQKVCSAIGSTSIRNVAAAPAKPVPVGVPDWTDCLVMLQQNQVAAVSTDDSILAGLAAQDPNTVVVGPRFSDEPYGIGINRDATDLVRFVNGVLAQLRADGNWTRLYTRWLTALGPAPLPPTARYRD
ncbi:glutamate ABC transporter substrate-binding protein [Micromonospora sp. NPDC005806]|uniref:glutamate ABC transporter substrate-binding protein n=1 Tax=Micromonospora sp. NPDC005806 TaxID=3364234 RepID=UPI0036BB87C9